MRTEIKPPFTELQKLAQLVENCSSRCSCNSPESRWSFYNPEQPQNSITALYEIFSQLRSKVACSPATFLDCGSGDGTAALVACLAGFEKVRGIEKNEELVQVSLKRLEYCLKQGIIGGSDVRFCCGSYYQPNVLPNLVEKCYETLLEWYQTEGIFETDSFKDYLCQLLGVNSDYAPKGLVANFLFSDGQSGFEELKIFDSNSGKLNVDVAYIYPSDIFFIKVFLPQMARLLKEGARLAVLTPNDDPILFPPSPLEQEEIFNLFDCFSPPMRLQVFQRT